MNIPISFHAEKYWIPACTLIQVVGVDLTTCKGGIRYVKIGLDRLLHVILLHVYNHVYSKRHTPRSLYMLIYVQPLSQQF